MLLTHLRTPAWPCSMTKLFDLMVMGVKMGIVVSTELDAPHHLALVRLSGVRALLVKYSNDELPDHALYLLDGFGERLQAAYVDMSPGGWWAMRITLLSFFEEQRIRVRLSCASTARKSH